ncbi:MAG: endonuclease/exonuclease/phosphatase family protein, partial [Rhodanobacteraceae bacterium]
GASWVVCGDFNLRPGAAPLSRLEAAGFSDAFAGRPGGFTTNSAGGSKRIDYIFYGAGLSCLTAAVAPIGDATPLPSAAEPSDHVPVVAELALEVNPGADGA